MNHLVHHCSLDRGTDKNSVKESNKRIEQKNGVKKNRRIDQQDRIKDLNKKN